MIQLTNQEKDFLQEMLEVYSEYINNKINSVREFIGLAHITGDIASAGEKYVQNKKFFYVKDNIVKHLEEQKRVANKLINLINRQ